MRPVLSEEEKRLVHDYAVRLYRLLVPLKAIAPELGGSGELRRAEAVEEELRSLGVEYRRIDSPDPRAEGGVRPNIVAAIPGLRSDLRLWIVAHLDTVPEGDPSLWTRPPFEASFEGDVVYGRGVEDNLQAVVTALALAKLLVREGVKPLVTVGLAFVADEEAGSRHGLRYLIEKEVFGAPSREWFIVPDAGSPDGSKMIVAEKHILWAKVVVEGRQAHASTPHQGLNAHRAGMKLNLGLDEMLHSRFAGYDPLYEPPYSTFEPTRKEENVGNINTIPAMDVVYWDMRILPSMSLDEVEAAIRGYLGSTAPSLGAKARVEIVAKDEAGEPTKPEHPLVRVLSHAIKETRGVEPRPIGIGGGTVARYLRREGYPAVVWMTCEETAHQPDEHTRLSYIVADVETLYYLVTESPLLRPPLGE